MIRLVSILIDGVEGQSTARTVFINAHKGLDLSKCDKLFPKESRLVADLLEVVEKYKDIFEKPKES